MAGIKAVSSIVKKELGSDYYQEVESIITLERSENVLLKASVGKFSDTLPEQSRFALKDLFEPQLELSDLHVETTTEFPKFETVVSLDASVGIGAALKDEYRLNLSASNELVVHLSPTRVMRRSIDVLSFHRFCYPKRFNLKECNKEALCTNYKLFGFFKINNFHNNFFVIDECVYTAEETRMIVYKEVNQSAEARARNVNADGHVRRHAVCVIDFVLPAATLLAFHLQKLTFDDINGTLRLTM